MAECAGCSTWARTDRRLTNHHPRCPAFEEKRFVLIALKGGSSYVEPLYKLADAMNGEFDSAVAGTSWTLTLVNMTQEEFDRLGDFAGH